MIDTTSTFPEDLPVETLAEARFDGDRVLPNRQKKPIDAMHCMARSPKHPDCEIRFRTVAQNAPCRRPREPHPPAAPAEEDTAYEAFVPKKFGEAPTADHVVLAKDNAADKRSD
eukprot:8709453-Pyramimonas_sp.AAC.1